MARINAAAVTWAACMGRRTRQPRICRLRVFPHRFSGELSERLGDTAANETNIRCVWTRTDGREQISLDIDQLSSGEKSLITLFLPLLETEVSTLLNRIDLTPGPVSAPDTLMIIDEPEQHIRNAVSLLESKVKQAHRKNTAYWATGLNDSY